MELSKSNYKVEFKGNVAIFSIDNGEENLFSLKLERLDENAILLSHYSTYEVINKYIKRFLENKEVSLKELEVRLDCLQWKCRKIVKEQGQDYSVPTGSEDKNQAPKTETKEAPVVKAKEVKKIVIEKPKAVGLEGQLQDLVYQVLEGDFTKQTIENKMIELGIEPNKTEIVVKKIDGAYNNVGVQHECFKDILTTISAGVNVALVGPAGSGKTTTVSNVAKALELPFYSKSVSAQTGVHEFFGYQDANGKYVRTLFRDAYENGGVFLLDEFDAGNPNVLASMNQATANGHCAFADGMVTKHEDFIVVMAGNTYGHGATSEYVGRNPIDKATLDRFAFIHFGYDNKMEYQLASNKEWCKEVQAIRERVSAKKVKAIVSPRATFDGSKLLAAGMSKSRVKELLIYKGLTQDEINLIK